MPLSKTADSTFLGAPPLALMAPRSDPSPLPDVNAPCPDPSMHARLVTPARALDPEYWRALCPELHVDDDAFIDLVRAMSDVGSGNGFARDVRARIIERGFTKIPSHKLPLANDESPGAGARGDAPDAARLEPHVAARVRRGVGGGERALRVCVRDDRQPSEPRRAAVARRRARRGADRVLAAQGQAARGRAAHVPGGRHGDVRHGVGATHGRWPGKLVPVLSWPPPNNTSGTSTATTTARRRRMTKTTQSSTRTTLRTITELSSARESLARRIPCVWRYPTNRRSNASRASPPRRIGCHVHAQGHPLGLGSAAADAAVVRRGARAARLRQLRVRRRGVRAGVLEARRRRRVSRFPETARRARRSSPRRWFRTTSASRATRRRFRCSTS